MLGEYQIIRTSLVLFTIFVSLLLIFDFISFYIILSIYYFAGICFALACFVLLALANAGSVSNDSNITIVIT